MKVLIADDEPMSLLFLQDTLTEWGYEVIAVSDGQSAREVLCGIDPPMLAIVDWMMPEMDGVDLCRAIRASSNDNYTYIIMLTARSETAYVVEAMNAGADDFICKPFHAEELEVRVRAGKRICDLEQLLRLRATHDALTGIYNRGAIIGLLEKALARHQRERGGLAVIFADLDHFKRINDVHGHLAGDAVLREVTRRIGLALRPYDSLGRYGGEELMVVLPVCDTDGAFEVAERIRKAVCDEPVATDFGAIPAAVSIGVAVLDQDNSCTLSEFVHMADRRLYIAKNQGRNRVVIAD